MGTYQGTENATEAGVRRYLLENYAQRNSDAMTDDTVTALLALYSTEIKNAENYRSFAYYVGDQIAKVEQLTYIGSDEDEDDSLNERDE